eukprot:Skav235752  [mRNA]  locus=scaffold803:92334:114013:+ [translate_table: standard]
MIKPSLANINPPLFTTINHHQPPSNHQQPPSNHHPTIAPALSCCRTSVRAQSLAFKGALFCHCATPGIVDTDLGRRQIHRVIHWHMLSPWLWPWTKPLRTLLMRSSAEGALSVAAGALKPQAVSCFGRYMDGEARRHGEHPALLATTPVTQQGQLTKAWRMVSQCWSTKLHPSVSWAHLRQVLYVDKKSGYNPKKWAEALIWTLASRKGGNSVVGSCLVVEAGGGGLRLASFELGTDRDRPPQKAPCRAPDATPETPKRSTSIGTLPVLFFSGEEVDGAAAGPWLFSWLEG